MFEKTLEQIEKSLKVQYEKGYSDGYAKAIDEFAEAIRNDSNYIFDNNFGYVIPINDIDEIAEELRCKG